MSTLARTLALAVVAATGAWAADIYQVTEINPNGPLPAKWGGLEGIWGSDINNAGQIVGGGSPDFFHSCWYGGFLYSDGVFSLSTVLSGPAVAINSRGQIAGRSCDGAYLYSDGVTTVLSYPGSATAINDSGQVVGYSWDSGGNCKAFLSSGGITTDLGFLPGDTQSQPSGINNSGQIVGWSMNASGRTEAFLYTGGLMTGLGTLPGYTDSVATAINDKGQIVGYATDSLGSEQAFLYIDGVMKGLGFLPGDVASEAQAINNKGQVVGASGISSFGVPPERAAFLYSGGQMVDLYSLTINSPNYFAGVAAVNDLGQVLMRGVGGPGFNLLTPLQGRFVPVTPCRVADTRTSPGPFGGPALDPDSMRAFAIPPSACGIPATAQAYSLNVTAVPHGPLGYLTLWPTGMAQPLVSTLNSWDGSVVANAAIVAAGQNGAVSVYALSNNPTDVILDINGYFDSTAGDSFYPVQPCRVADTRRPAGALGGPALSTGETRDFPVLSSPCGLPAAATAYSTNVTVVPAGFLSYLTTWATGQPQPSVSTLNSWTGKVVANAAIVPAGTNGATSVYVTNPTDVILDANGYFAPPGSPGALTFYPVVPCRVADTRAADGGPEMAAGTTRSFAVPTGGCGIPSGAASYSLNITVVPDGPLSYLSAWPTGSPQPFVSTLNSLDGTVVANAAIVPAGSDGAISIYVTNQTHVILDINGYFAP